MKHVMYITEPEVINMPVVEAIMEESGTLSVTGTVTFEGSDKAEFDTIVIRSETKVGDDVKQYFPHLQNIVRIGTGLDNVDLGYCRDAGIKVYNAAGANADAVSEYIVGVMLMAMRRLHTMGKQDLLDWNRFAFVGKSFSGQTVGLVGFGNIGKLIHGKLAGFKYKDFLVYDPYINKANLPDGVKLVDNLDDLLRAASIVSLHLPLTPETENLISKDKMALLPEGAILINAARGGIVDEAAVIELLGQGSPFTYIADTVVGEPHGNPGLFENDNIIVTPHIASLTDDSEHKMIEVALDNFLHQRNVAV